jgi:hypothetical protein
VTSLSCVLRGLLRNAYRTIRSALRREIFLPLPLLDLHVRTHKSHACNPRDNLGAMHVHVGCTYVLSHILYSPFTLHVYRKRVHSHILQLTVLYPVLSCLVDPSCTLPGPFDDPID